MPVRFPNQELNQRPLRAPGTHDLPDAPNYCLVAQTSYSTIGLDFVRRNLSNGCGSCFEPNQHGERYKVDSFGFSERQ
jgi:hypothetical protein